MDINKLVGELRKVKPFPDMSLEVFVALRELLPMVAIELFIVKNDGSFALVKKTGQFNGWAMPGGYVGFNESFEDACGRIANKELGIDLKSIQFVSVFNWPCGSVRPAKGHVVSIIFKCTAVTDSKMAEYFFSVPGDLLKHHAVMLKEII